MDLKELEKEQNIKFPELFHNIYESGMMEWLTQSYEWIRENFSLTDEDKSFLEIVQVIANGYLLHILKMNVKNYMKCLN